MDELFNKRNFIDKNLIDAVSKLIRKIRSAPNPLEELINQVQYLEIPDIIQVILNTRNSVAVIFQE